MARLSFEIEHKMVVIIKASFAFFDCLIIGSDSNFSSRVLGANFCCATEIKEITARYNLAVEAAKLDGAYEMIISLRDVVVILMVNNIWQKSYFSNGGDEVHALLEKSLFGEANATMEQMREFLLTNANTLYVHLCNQATTRKVLKKQCNLIMILQGRIR